MTVAPSHPPVHSYDPGKNPIELVDTPSGKMERWRADALLTGETSALTAISAQVRNDAASIVARQDAREAALNSREDSIAERERVHAVNVTQFVDFVGKASVLFDRLNKLRADQAEEPLAHPPGDPSDPSKEPEPSLALEDEEQPAHGDPPGTEPKEGQDPRGEFLRLKYPVTTDEPEFPDPDLPAPPQFQPPVAAGLDKE